MFVSLLNTKGLAHSTLDDEEFDNICSDIYSEFWRLEEEKEQLLQQAEEEALEAREKAEEEERLAKKKVEDEERLARQQEDELKRLAFIDSADYRYIELFVKKYGHQYQDIKWQGFYPGSELNKLWALIPDKWELSSEQLVVTIKEEIDKQSFQKIQPLILSGSSTSYDDLILNFLEACGDNYKKYVPLFIDLLMERGVTQTQDSATIISDIWLRKGEIELKLFEAKLLEETPAPSLSDVDLYSGYEFEGFLKVLFTKMGYQVEHTRLSGDQGADLVLSRFGERTVVQAKCYSDKVGNKAIQEIVAAQNHYKANKGIVVTNNFFTNPAKDLAGSNQIELIDREKLKMLINKWW